MSTAPRTTLLKAELWRLAIPVLWFGMIGAISFIEAPLKFQAPGITIPLGLGIGRLVFAALNIAEGVLLVMMAIATFWPKAARVTRARSWWWVALAAVFLFKVAVVRPPLNQRTDLVLLGADPGQSPWHYVYIVCDVIMLVLLAVLAAKAGRAALLLVAEASAGAGETTAPADERAAETETQAPRPPSA